MPWHVAKSAECPDDKPYAVIKDSDGSVEGCHASEAEANDQLQALYANESSARQPYERRTFAMELRSDGTVISGHAAVTDQLSEEMGGFFGPWQERIAPGAFDEAVRAAMDGSHEVYALLNHDPNIVIASTTDRSLRLSVDGTGLFAQMTPMDTQTIRDLVVQPVREGKLRKMSFGFNVADEHDEKRDGKPIRVIDKIGRLFDVSVVTFPAYPQTDVQANGLLAHMGIDPLRLSGPEYVSFRSLITRHLPGAPSQAGRASADRRDGAGAPVALLRRRLELERDLSKYRRKEQAA